MSISRILYLALRLRAGMTTGIYLRYSLLRSVKRHSFDTTLLSLCGTKSSALHPSKDLAVAPSALTPKLTLVTKISFETFATWASFTFRRQTSLFAPRGLLRVGVTHYPAAYRTFAQHASVRTFLYLLARTNFSIRRTNSTYPTQGIFKLSHFS